MLATTTTNANETTTTQNADGSSTLAAPTVQTTNSSYQPGSIGPGNTPLVNTPVSSTPPPTPSLNSTSLAPQTPIQVTQPATTSPYNISTLPVPASVTTPPLTETTGEKQQSDISKELEALTTTDAGKAAYTTQQENAAGIPALQQSQTDLGTQLKSLQVQDQNQAQGRGITTGGLAPLDAAQALNISAQIDATNGLLSSAQQKVTSAVNQQFGPIEAQMAALSANLKNIANDPQSTIDEKNQAQAQLDNVAAQQAQIAQQKQNATDVWTLATTAASYVGNFTPTAQYQTAAQAIKAIQNAPDKATALQIAINTGLTADKATTKLDTSVQEVNGQKVLINNQTGEQIKDLGASTAPKDPATTAAETTVTNTVNNIVDGNTSLTDLVSSTGVPDPNTQNIKAQLQTLGFYSDTPPSWYVQGQNDQAGQDVLPSVTQTSWTAYRNKALGTDTSS